MRYIISYIKYYDLLVWHICNFSSSLPGNWVIYAWCVGDVFYVNWDEVLVGATAVVSTLGGFGSEEQMQKINGEANVVAVNAAKEYGEELYFILQLKSLWDIFSIIFHYSYFVILYIFVRSNVYYMSF